MTADVLYGRPSVPNSLLLSCLLRLYMLIVVSFIMTSGEAKNSQWGESLQWLGERCLYSNRKGS